MLFAVFEASVESKEHDGESWSVEVAPLNAIPHHRQDTRSTLQAFCGRAPLIRLTFCGYGSRNLPVERPNRPSWANRRALSPRSAAAARTQALCILRIAAAGELGQCRATQGARWRLLLSRGMSAADHRAAQRTFQLASASDGRPEQSGRLFFDGDEGIAGAVLARSIKAPITGLPGACEPW